MEDDLGRRIAAARAYAGIKSQAKLGEILGLSQSTMQRIEAGGRGMKAYERRTALVAIAEACGLPYAWFTADFSRLAEIPMPSETAQSIADAELAASQSQNRNRSGE